MNAWAYMDVDDIITCRSHDDKHVSNMWDIIGNGYGYKLETVASNLIVSHYHVERSCNKTIV